MQHLVPGKEYEFMVLSQDKYGDGMFSKQFRFQTQGEVPHPMRNSINISKTLNSTASPIRAEDFDAQQLQHDDLDQMPTSATAGGLGAPGNLTAVSNQQGWLLHWEHPTQGLEGLRLYAVRWWKEPEHFLIGHAETFDNFYQLRHLKEDTTFKVQVLAVGTNTHLSVPSHELLIDVPSQRKVRALIIGSSVGVIFLLCALCAFLYVKRSCLRHLFAGDSSAPEGDEDTAESGDCDSDEQDSVKIRQSS